MNYEIESLDHHTLMHVTQIVGVTYVGANDRMSRNDGVLFRLSLPTGDGHRDVIVSSMRRHTGDVRGAKRAVQAAFCRLTGMTQKKLREASEAYAADELRVKRESNIDYIQEFAAHNGIKVTIEE
jgi:hypothetical protein